MNQRPDNFAKFFDHTLLKANATPAEISMICSEARQHNFFGVCVNLMHLPLAVSELKNSGVVPLTVVGFPLGATPSNLKADETKWAVDQGAGEVDMVLAVGSYLGGNTVAASKDIEAVVKAAGKVPVKVIIETAYLNAAQIAESTLMCAKAGAAFVKTSTGFAPRGASVEDIQIISKTLRDNGFKNIGIKASGGVKELNFALALIEAGATRLGSSSSVQMVTTPK